MLRATEVAVARLIADHPDAEPQVHEARETPALPELRTQSLFGGTTCVVLRGMHEASESLKADVDDYLEHPDPHAILLMTAKGTGKIRKIAAAVGKLGEVEEDRLPKPWQEREWQDVVRMEAKRCGRRIDAEALHELLERSGQSPAMIASNVTQVALAYPDVDSITGDHVRAVVTGVGNHGAGRVSDAVMQRDPAAALVALRGALEAGEAPLGIIGMLAARFRSMLALKGPGGQREVLARLGRAAWRPSVAGAAAPKTSNPGQLGFLRSDAARFGPGELGWCHDRLARADLQLKGDTDLPDDIVMELTIIDVATPRDPGPPWRPR